ncbi:sigma-70 family RNA polymerase sigma factor [Nocardioides flavescens]|uniref:sigma-70 family RNA polymerase sigma factor n=1 Tax=Nocardioides flavescens TaxID=2691959 RepID=UPI00301CB862
MTDELLHTRVVPARGPSEYEEFVAATSTRMLRTAVLLTGDRHVAEDLVQSTYAQVFVRWRLVRRAESPLAYTRTILTRRFLADRRRRRVSELPLLTETDRAAITADPTLRLSLLQVLGTLPALDRTVLVLRYFHDLPVAEVAAQVDLSESACRTRASRALARLRTHFPDLADQA